MECGGRISVGSGLEMMGFCSNEASHAWADRRKSTKCGCGKWQCPAPGSQSPGGIWSCYQHPDYGFDTSTSTGNQYIPKHHTDGTQACETNHRTSEEQIQWQEEHAKWKDAQATLPDLAKVMVYLEEMANPLSFDGHDNFQFVANYPEKAAICIHHMFKTLQGIQIGQAALAKLSPLKGI